MLLFLLQNLLEPRSLIISACKRTVVKPARRCREPREHWRHIHEVALEARGQADRTQAVGKLGTGAADGQGDPGGGRGPQALGQARGPTPPGQEWAA